MPSYEVETEIWCPKCRGVKGEVIRKPGTNQGVFEHFTRPDPIPKKCDQCDTVLTRKS